MRFSQFKLGPVISYGAQLVSHSCEHDVMNGQNRR